MRAAHEPCQVWHGESGEDSTAEQRMSRAKSGTAKVEMAPP